MDVSRFIGSATVRLIALVLAASFAWVALGVTAGRLPWYAALVSGLLAWIAVVHSSRPLYAWWMRVAEALHTLVITVLFGACYLLIVPLFGLLTRRRDPLRLRRRRLESSWEVRRGSIDARSLERMG